MAKRLSKGALKPSTSGDISVDLDKGDGCAFKTQYMYVYVTGLSLVYHIKQPT